MKEGYWVVRTYEAGPIGEKTKFWVPGPRPSSRNRRKEKSELRKQEQNEHAAKKALARLLNENFGKGDLLLGLDYNEDGMARLEKSLGELPESEEERTELLRQAAQRELCLCIRRVQRELKKEGVQLRYAGAITSDMDGDTGEAVRVHHHLVVNREAQEAFVRKWAELGSVDWSPLSGQPDYTPIAEYLLRQVRRLPDAKSYISSRNLRRPRPKDRIASSGAELRLPKGCSMLFRSEYKPGRPQYIRYVLPEDRRGSPGGTGGEDV